MRLAVGSGLLLWAGTTLLLSQLRWFTRLRLADRLRPYAPGGAGAAAPRHALSVESVRDVIAPLCRGVGERVARALGVTEELAVRLERLHSPLDVTAFRLRQVGWSLAGFGVAALATVAVHPPPLAGFI
ncbi:MAG: hypothetical protein M3144_00810, partial [Actinomycetota bacterium]|nr:hypothetical protein [Actinomycetota bacterium]